LGDYFSAADTANVRHRLAGLDIQAFPNGFFTVLAHPYVLYDFMHDPAVGGFQDLAKYNVVESGKYTKMEDRGFVARVNNCEIYEDTNVTMVAGSPNKYRVYFFGQEGLAAIDLAGRGPSRSEDQNRTRFKVNVIQPGLSVADPMGKIKALASYNFVFCAKILDTNPYRLRKIDAPTSLGL
jgi:hypothetical protein